MEEALRADLLTLTHSPTPKRADGRKHCQYHQNLGYTTEDCITLKDKLEILIQAGHLRRYVHDKRRSPLGDAKRPPKRNNYSRMDNWPKKNRSSRSRSRERPLRGVINTISGGFAGGGPSASARKRHLRSLHSVNRVEMDISEDMIMLFHEQILGFAGERVDTRGYVDLRMCLGTEKKAKELKIRFLLVEANTSYNVLLGRPCLNAFEAIVSTPHLTLKYPPDNGKICVI
ncbi:uncharacterized protein LOC108319367 [Vigna angularis]|uniref:uncharacterized protein LOC108319367 n=1 Tax=Phaseolus angularis TaxID=3914 RepID=UPI00080A6BD9|nr:uncharacterized protein LOC108319367 [Vigna angularis]